MSSRRKSERAFLTVCFVLSCHLLVQTLHSLEKDSPRGETRFNTVQSRRRRGKFITNPHRASLSSGPSAQCRWENVHDGGIKIATRAEEYTRLDYTQRTALSEGICISSQSLKEHVHIFSSAEAIECLSSSPQLILTGDSYMKQLYIGLADILLSKHVSKDVEITNSEQRTKVLNTAQNLIVGRKLLDKSFPSVTFGCPEECYGKKHMRICSDCMNDVSSELYNNVTWVLGVGIHPVSRHYHSNQKKDDIAINATIHEITNFLDTQRQEHQRRVVFVSSPSYHYNTDYPTQHQRMSDFYHQFLPEIASRPPFVDVFQATDSCVWKNCSLDGSHRSRFVNRWKAQLLLNTLCEFV
jgi:hypothetical protein